MTDERGGKLSELHRKQETWPNRRDGTFQPARSIVTLKKKKRERNIIISTCWTPGSQFGQVSVAQNSPLWEMGSSAFMPSLMNYLWD